jgi:hypothetical protein
MTNEAHIAPPEGVLDRLSVGLHSRRLDEALARGIPPETTPSLALRARRLTTLSRRREIADGLRHVMRETCRGARSPAQVSPRRSQVAAADEELTRLADALATPGPVAARGAAEAWILLTDGTGPLYNAESPASLRARAAGAARDLCLDCY